MTDTADRADEVAETPPEIINEDPHEENVVYVVLPRWVVNALMDEARELGFITKRGRPATGSESGLEKGSLKMLLTEYARRRIQRHIAEHASRVGSIEDISGTADLPDDEEQA